MFCNKCGASLPDGCCFCNKCGATLPDDSCFGNKCPNHIVPQTRSVEPPVDECAVCDILIVHYEYSERFQMIRLLKDELGMPNVTELLNKNPIIIGEVVYAEALYLKSRMEEIGAKVEIHSQCAERLSYESEREAICKAFGNMSPDDCIPVLVPRNNVLQRYIEGKQKVFTGGILSSVPNMIFRKKHIRECENLAPVINAEMVKSKQLMKQMLEALNAKYGNSYFTLPAKEAAEKMSETIFLYINTLDEFEQLV